MGCRSFHAGGSFPALPVNTRGRIFARSVLLPGYDVELHSISFFAQGSGDDMLVELLNGGRTLLSELLNNGSHYALPFLLFPAQGQLELFITNGASVQATVDAHVSGIYVPVPRS